MVIKKLRSLIWAIKERLHYWLGALNGNALTCTSIHNRLISMIPSCVPFVYLYSKASYQSPPPPHRSLPPHPQKLLLAIITPAHMQGVKWSVLSVLCHHLSHKKLPYLNIILETEQTVNTTKRLETAKNLLVFASNHLARLTNTTNLHFIAIPIAVHVLSVHTHKLVRHWCAKVTNKHCMCCFLLQI